LATSEALDSAAFLVSGAVRCFRSMDSSTTMALSTSMSTHEAGKEKVQHLGVGDERGA